MPFRIIRDDITRVHADAIVNTANPRPRFGAGTDAAVYRAAGQLRLLAARRKIGDIAPGDAAVTPAFRLPAKYIIHTVGPAWVDGRHREYDTLWSCYHKSLVLADQLGCASIAFPLISTGTYGFPKDVALQMALDAFREHLEHSDIDITLVVFGRDSYQLAASLVDRVDQYIDENYCAEQLEAEYGDYGQLGGAASDVREARRLEQATSPRVTSASSAPSAPRPKAAPPAGGRMAVPQALPAEVMASAAPFSLEDALNNLGESFQTTLFRFIDERGMTDAEVYKRANLDRKLFSKIRCNEGYLPKKRTIVALAIALRLNMAETRELLASAGLTLTNNSIADVIVSYCIESGTYDIIDVNALLFRYNQPTLG